MQELKNLLANTYALYLKTQNFHWNIEGSDFFELHELFEQHYLKLATDVDIIAEIIRVLGAKAPGSFTEFLAMSQISEANSNTSSKVMVEELIVGYNTVINLIKKCLDAIDNSEHGIKHKLISLMEEYQKTVWMLSSWSK